jgi:hypothetical protein
VWHNLGAEKLAVGIAEHLLFFGEIARQHVHSSADGQTAAQYGERPRIGNNDCHRTDKLTADDSRGGHPRGARDRDKISVSVHFACRARHTLHAGVDPLPLLRRQRIPPRLLREPQARISVQQFADLQTSTMLAMGDESLGYAPRPMPLGTWDMMCHAVINSHTLGQALAPLLPLLPAHGEGTRPALRHDDRRALCLARG